MPPGCGRWSVEGSRKMKISPRLLVISVACSFSACSSLGGGEYGFSDYTLVRVHRVQVGDGSLSVAPPRPWNRHRGQLFFDVRDVEDWTLNGPLLDGISFVSGLKSGRYLIYQR